MVRTPHEAPAQMPSRAPEKIDDYTLYTHELLKLFAQQKRGDKGALEYFTQPTDQFIGSFSEFLEKYEGGNGILENFVNTHGGKSIPNEVLKNLNINYNSLFPDTNIATAANILTQQFNTGAQQGTKNIQNYLSSQQAQIETILTKYGLLGTGTQALWDQKTKFRNIFFDKLNTNINPKTPPLRYQQYDDLWKDEAGLPLHEIKNIWKEFINDKNIKIPESAKKELLEYFTFEKTNPQSTETVETREYMLCSALINKVYDHIDQIYQGTDPEITRMRKELMTTLANKANKLSSLVSKKDQTIPGRPDLISPAITITDLLTALHDGFKQYEESINKPIMKLLDIAQRGQYKAHFQLTYDDILKSGDQLYVQGKDKSTGKSYKDVHNHIKPLINSFAQADMISNIHSRIRKIDKYSTTYPSTFEVPSNMKAFFEHFGTITNASKQQQESLQIQISHYQSLLKNPNLDPTLVKQYQNKLMALEEQLQKAIKTQDHLDWEGYFDKIDQELADKASKTKIVIAPIKDILLKLKDEKRDSTKISPDEQGKLAKAMALTQIGHIMDQTNSEWFGYAKTQYLQLVDDLYNLNNHTHTITTNDNQQISLTTRGKKMVGQAPDGVDTTKHEGLEHLRLEYQIDLNNNPDAEAFIRMVTGGPTSNVIFDISEWNKPHFAPTFTESSKVRLRDKNGIIYEGYLSPIDLTDDDSYGKNHKNDKHIANTFILYSEPVDQIHDQRTFVTKRDASGNPILTNENKQQPIYINGSNLDDWESFEVLDKVVTLSDKQLQAVLLGAQFAGKMTKDDIIDSSAPHQYNNWLKRQNIQDNDLLKKHLDTTDQHLHYTTDTPTQDQETTDADVFKSSWEKLGGSMDTCKVGARIALKLHPQLAKKMKVRSFPIGSEEFVSAVVKNVKTDSAGQIIGVTIDFEQLSRPGDMTMKNIEFTANKLDILSDSSKNLFAEAIYLDNINSDSQTYEDIFTRMKTKFSSGARKKSYERGMLKELEFDENKQQFLKNKNPVTRFIALGKTTDADSKDSKTQYLVSYTIKAVGPNQFEVSSSPYSSSYEDTDGNTHNHNISFSTKTDLAGMLLILANKKLVPHTDEEYELRTKQFGDETIPKKEGKMYSIRARWKVLSGMTKNAVEEIKKKIANDDEDDLKFTLFQEYHLLHRISSSWIGKTLDIFDYNVFEDMADDAEHQGMEYGWKKIESTRNDLAKYHPSYNVNAGSGFAKARGIIESAISAYKNNKSCSMKQRRKTAGALLYILDKMKTGYPNELNQYPTGTYVQILFGPHYYNMFLQHYRRIEAESKFNNDAGKKAQDQLALLEYNFIMANITGGDVQVKDEAFLVTENRFSGTDGSFETTKSTKQNPSYFQNLYGRKFAGELKNLVNQVKFLNTDAKELIDQNNPNHMYEECKGNMKSGRVEGALQALYALQKTATNEEQMDKVIELFMAGILSGLFTNNLSKKDKSDLATAMKNSSMPYAHLVTLFDGRQQLKALLELATTNNDTNGFSKFVYGDKSQGKQKNYMPDDFTALNGNKQKGLFIDEFSKRFQTNKGSVLSFLHMEPSSMNSENNLINIWKNSQPSAFGKPVPSMTKVYINDMMNKFYEHSSNIAQIGNLNTNSGLKHTASLSGDYFPQLNRYTDGSWNADNEDQASQIWDNLDSNAPQNKAINQGKEDYLLAWNVNEFFRTFNGIGGIAYNKTSINMFYKYIRLAQSQPKGSDDQIRILWFYLTELLYHRGPVPDVVERTFKKYMSYFETNLDNFTSTVGKFHNVPQGGETFESSFGGSLGLEYKPEMEWMKLSKRGSSGKKEMNRLTQEAQQRGNLLLNSQMDQKNSQALGSAFNYYGNGNKIGMSYDAKIAELRGNKKFKFQNYQQLHVLDNEIRTTNASDIDFSQFRS